MRIGELSQTSGVPTSTIRYYEQRGLISKPARTASGYRQYDESALQQLQLIRMSQQLGFSLDDLPRLLDTDGNWDHQQILTKLSQHKADMQKLIEQLTVQLSVLGKLENVLSNTWAQGKCLPYERIKALLDETTNKNGANKS
ncbi:MerR family transcriptional regulator [Aestuariibacter salexigens]|uniref:MerR family transcriptional regulator n=1 Tax=Aestuariibacter salexigens TaxID=226010 RepID=UPI00040DDCCC|nr:MerR family transcriptional regulator [Aestuariibacter salexigens]